MTKSEKMFEDFCIKMGIAFHRIKEGPTKSPDYIISIFDTQLVVEVKQIEPNQDEKELLRIPLEEWNPENVYHWGIPGERIRKKILDAMPQLKMLSDGHHPALLVILNTVETWPELADDYAIQVAMYGIESIFISSEVAQEGGAKILDRWHGPRKRLTSNCNTTLSGIALMELEDSDIIFKVYHNYHASIPLPKRKLIKLGLRQYEMPFEPGSKFPEWREINPQQGH